MSNNFFSSMQHTLSSITEDKKTWMKDGVEMCSKDCCGKPVTECTCGPDCKHCDCYQKNNSEVTNEDMSNNEIDAFHRALDALVHKHLGHGSHEKDDEADEVNEADTTKYGIVRYPDTAISYIKNDGDGWEHIYDRSYGFEGPVDKADLQYAKKIAKEKIPSRMFESSEMMTEAQFDEAAGEKDACYRKVKSRYKVWPSAYASGALVKCRKVGASNWGNSKK